ncbi:MAG: aminotransferase class V-fold PLP-dependent enzyme [Bacteroidetes bacterium]|nr:aminotransferase class V-fold PLP-dependent enzyme [Bacteroidota bacterium]
MIPLYKPYMPGKLPKLELILHSGELSYGKWGHEFEKRLNDYIGFKNILVTNSFNSAMLVVLTTLGISQGDEIIASPMSCLASNQPFTCLGIKVVWADIDPSTGTLNPDNVSCKISSKTKAIFHNHHCGYLGYIDEINAIARNNGLYVIDDAIEAFGSVYKGNKIGNVGSDVSVFSFQTVRLPNSIDGGAVHFKDPIFTEKAKRVRDYGIDRNKFRNYLGEISKTNDIFDSGYGATLNEINSYIGCLQLDQIDELLFKQRNNALAWEVFLKKNDLKVEILSKAYQTPNYWIYGILTPNKTDTIKYFRTKGYYASGVHLPNNYYSVFGSKSELLGVNDFYSKFVALPCGWWFSLND